jgi:hypothetical protein
MKVAGFPFMPVSLPFPPFVLRLAPTHLGWDTRRQFTRRSRDPPGVETPTTVLHHIHPTINTPSYPLPLHTLNTLSQGKPPPTQLLRSAGYAHSVASPPIHPPGKHLRSTTSNIITPHDIDSSQDSTHPYIAILTTILSIC